MIARMYLDLKNQRTILSYNNKEQRKIFLNSTTERFFNSPKEQKLCNEKREKKRKFCDILSDL
jgi:hypothetical protein